MSIFTKIPDVTSRVKNALANIVGTTSNRLTGTSVSKQAIIALLQSKSPDDQLKALKMILALYFARRDVGEYLSHVANLMTTNYEVKKLAYFFLNAIGNAHKREVLMCINSFHKETGDKQPLVRATALRALTGLRLSEIVELLLVTVQKSLSDFSLYVRKTATLNLLKLNEIDESLLPQLSDSLSKVLKDPYMLVTGPAILVLHLLFPNRLDLLHPHFRRICRGIAAMEEWYVPTVLTALMRYARTYLDKRMIGEEKVDPDLRLLLENVDPLFHSNSPSVILSAATVFYHLASESRLRTAAHSLLIFRSCRPEIAALMLDMSLCFAKKSQEVYTGFHTFFYLTQKDTVEIAQKKLAILTLLVTEANSPAILRELVTYTHSENPQIAAISIRAIGTCAQKPVISDACTKQLVSLLKSQRPTIISQCIIVLRGLISLSPEKYHKVIIHCAKFLDTLESSSARASAIWIIGAYNDKMPTLALETIRRLVISFPTETDREVKNQIVNAVVRLYESSDGDRKQKAGTMLKYLLEICKYDHHYDIRDKARLLNAIFFEDGPMRQIADKKLMEVREEAPIPSDSLFLPSTISTYIGRKVDGYAKLWDDFMNIEVLRSLLMEDTVTLREEEETVSLAAVMPPQTHYSSEDTPKIGDTGLKQRSTTVTQKSLNAFLESSEEDDDDEDEEDSDS